MTKYKDVSVLRIAQQDRQLRQVSSWNGILDVFRQLRTERRLRKRKNQQRQ